jgi:hypothetical protein
MDENSFFSRLGNMDGGGQADAATDSDEGDDEGDRRHLLQAGEPKEPKEVSFCIHRLRARLLAWCCQLASLRRTPAKVSVDMMPHYGP